MKFCFWLWPSLRGSSGNSGTCTPLESPVVHLSRGNTNDNHPGIVDSISCEQSWFRMHSASCLPYFSFPLTLLCNCTRRGETWSQADSHELGRGAQDGEGEGRPEMGTVPALPGRRALCCPVLPLHPLSLPHVKILCSASNTTTSCPQKENSERIPHSPKGSVWLNYEILT